MACGVSPDTVRRCLRDAEVLLFSHPVMPFDYVPPGGEDWRTLAAFGFAKYVGVKCIILAVDGHKVGCKAPVAPSERSAYYCGTKGPFITMGYAVDDAQTPRFVMGGFPGSTNDVTALRSSTLWKAMEDPESYNHESPKVPKDRVVIADSAYMIRDWLMTPFLEHSVERELCPLEMLAFNFFLSAARQKVEHFNGRLTQMCAPIRDRGQQRGPDMAVRLARTCVGLMSFGIQHDTINRTGRLGRSVHACRSSGRFAPEGPRLVRLDRSQGPVGDLEAKEAGKTNRRRLATAWVAAKGRSVVVRMGPDRKFHLFWFNMVLAQPTDGFLIDAVVAQRAAMGLPPKYASFSGLASSAGNLSHVPARGSSPSAVVAATSLAAEQAATAAGFVLATCPDDSPVENSVPTASEASAPAAASAPVVAVLDVDLPGSEVGTEEAQHTAAAESTEGVAACDLHFAAARTSTPPGVAPSRSSRTRARPRRYAEFEVH